MSETEPLVGIVVVSHPRRLAEGVVEVAAQMAGDRMRFAAVGGAPDGSIGTDADRIADGIRQMDSAAGVLVLGDLGSAILASESAVEMLGDSLTGAVTISSGPLVEGAVVAAVQASIGLPLNEVAASAEEARNLDKGSAR